MLPLEEEGGNACIRLMRTSNFGCSRSAIGEPSSFSDSRAGIRCQKIPLRNSHIPFHTLPSFSPEDINEWSLLSSNIKILANWVEACSACSSPSRSIRAYPGSPSLIWGLRFRLKQSKGPRHQDIQIPGSEAPEQPLSRNKEIS